MASLYVTEYAVPGNSHGLVPVAYGAPITTQKITFTGTAGTSAAFNASTTLIRVSNDATGPASILISNAGTAATVGDARLFTNAVEYFAVKGGQFISAIVNT